MSESGKRCRYCGKELKQAPNEKNYAFANRVFCSRSCAGKSGGERRPRGRHPKSIGIVMRPKDINVRWE